MAERSNAPCCGARGYFRRRLELPSGMGIRVLSSDSAMASHGNWLRPILSKGEGFIYYSTRPQPMLSQQFCAGSKHASRYHKKNTLKHTVTIDRSDIPVSATQATGSMLCLSLLSAVFFTCALIFHGIMFYYALETPMWFLMCWPFVLIPPIICNSIYIACMAKKVPVTRNGKMVCLYVLFALAYMAWASYIIATTFKQGRCNEASYYSLVGSVLALATLACVLEWCISASKFIKRTPSELNISMALYEKSPTKRRLVVTLKINGKVIKETKFNLDKFIQDCNMNYNGPYKTGTIHFYNNEARYGNEKYKQCPMKYHGHCSAGGSQFRSTVCRFENEKLKQEWPMKYIRQYLKIGAPLKNENNIIQDQFTEECETDHSSFNSNTTQNNKNA